MNYVTKFEKYIVKVGDKLNSEMDELWRAMGVMREAFEFYLHKQVDVSVAQGLGLQASSLVA